ncbi:MAG: hypothetical protein ACYC2G_08070 [Gemmatimonadaceae bacterium]
MPTAPILTLTRAPRRVGARSAVSALRLRRRPARLAPVLAALAAAGVLLASRPTPAEARPVYEMCVELVVGWYEDCSDGAGNVAQQFGCDWIAGVGYIACGLVGAAEAGGPIIIQKLQ